MTASIHVVSRHSEVESPNVAAILPGSDPGLKAEYVVFTAHLDHLGIGDPVNGDAIYNGAGDNASGTAALIEIARTFTRMPQAPRRSLLFIAVTGEEDGLLGSDYYAHNPTVPPPQIVADVNMDEVSFLYDFRDIVPLGAEHSSLGAVVDDVAHHMGLESESGSRSGRSLFRSQRPVLIRGAGSTLDLYRRRIQGRRSKTRR